MRLELGGGSRAKDGFVNMDLIETADIRHDLNSLPWPLEDESVDEVYSSHCLEHLRDPNEAIVEIARACRVGAPVTIRVPAMNSDGAMVPGHTCVLTEVWFLNVTKHYPLPGFAAVGKLLTLTGVKLTPDPTWFPRARESRLFKDWTDDEIMTWLPHACHEYEFQFVVERFSPGR